MRGKGEEDEGMRGKSHLSSDGRVVAVAPHPLIPSSPHPPPDCILIQQASGAHEELLRFAEPYHQAYCERHGIEYCVLYGEAKLTEGRHPYWEKVGLIRAALREGYPYVIWLDADCLIVDEEADLRSACVGVSLTYHDLDRFGFRPPAYDHFNCGAVYIHNTSESRAFVEDWWKTDDEGHPWHDQHALNKICSNRCVLRAEHRWNSTAPHFESPDPVVRAWHGFGSVADRLREMQKAVGVEPAPDEILPIADIFTRAQRHIAEGRKADAERDFRAILKQSPDEVEVLPLLASLLGERGEHVEAARWLKQLLAYHPNVADAWRMLGAAHMYMGEHEQSLSVLRRAVSLAPHCPEAQWNLALAEIKAGLWAQGWPRQKWGTICGQRSQRTLKREWAGQDLQGRTLFAWADLGLGDTINMVRFLEQVRIRGAGKVILEVQAPLVGLLKDFPDADHVFMRTQDRSIPYDWDEHVSLMSLPAVLGITPDSVSGEPYLDCLGLEPEQIAGDGLKIGLCRSGSQGNPNDRHRSIPAAEMLPFRDVEKDLGVTLVSLHQEPGNGLYDVVDTARRILGCDLVITVDTMVAHLAGALGKPVWMLISKSCDYRWLDHGDRTCWYRSARLYRQEKLDDWAPVIARAISHLTILVNSYAQRSADG